jgi:hypothetical protein
MAIRPLPDALATKFREVAQDKVNDAAFAAVHGVELKRHAGLQDFLCRRRRAHAQLFDAQKPVIVSIEADSRMLLAGHAQHFHGELFESEHRFRLVSQQDIDIPAGELHQQIGSFKILMHSLTRNDVEHHVEAGERQQAVEKTLDLGSSDGNAKFGVAHSLSLLLLRYWLDVDYGGSRRRTGKPIRGPLLHDSHQIPSEPV